MNKKKRSIYIYILLIILLTYLIFNPTARKIFSRYVEYYKLSSNLELAEQSNLEYKKRLYYLETKPSHMERIVKSELGVIAEGEVEYRFNQETKNGGNTNEI
ncbi:MAG: hypothetical protein WCS83_00975 [Endomicrobiia bacterium]|nr:hypothetical protein [Endomicrobiaceae bacterium]MDD3922113.1 hypothetical protein [Endomicrobiaceae bacterium]MDD5101518.1 hypothetical protein [Endomicrobiaceae bacterium]